MADLGDIKRKVTEYEAKGDVDKAIAELEKAVKDFPKEGSLFNKLGDLYIKVKEEEEALNIYEKGARAFKEETYFPNAIALCKKILRIDKERTEIYGLLGELHKELDQRGEAANYLLEYADRKIKEKELEIALNAYTTIKELVPNNSKILQTISAIYEQMGKKDEADKLLIEAKQVEADQGKLKEQIATTKATQPTEIKIEKEKPKEVKETVAKEKEIKEPEVKEVEEKVKETEEVKEAIPEQIKEKAALEEFVSPEVAELLKEEKKEDEVSLEEEETVELSEIERTIELGELYLSLGSDDEAIDCFRTAANEAMETKDYDMALSLNSRIAEMRPFDLKSRQHLVEIAKFKEDDELQVKTLLELAEALNRLDAKNEAQSVYNKILEIDPKNTMALERVAASEQPKDFIDLGEVLRTEMAEEKKVGDIHSIDDLISEFRREVFESIGEGDHRSHYDLGVAYKGMGLYQEAIEEFEIAAKDENLKLKASEMIGSCFLERGKIDEALRVLNEALKTSNRPSQEYFGLHFLIGKCYEDQKKLTESLKSYVNAYNIDKTVPDLIKKINILKQKLTDELNKKGRKTRTKTKAGKRHPPKTEKGKTKKSKITYL